MGFVRASIMEALLSSIADVRPALAAPSAALVPSLVQEWVPVAESLALHDLMRACCDDATSQAIYVRSIARQHDGALLGPVWRAALALIGKNPAKHLRWVPNAWPMTTRGLGRMTFSATDDGGTLKLTGVPAPIAASPDFR